MGNGLRRAVFIGFFAFAFLALVLSCAFLSSDALDAPSVYALGSVPPEGEGTKTSPYLATQAEHIMWLSGNVSSGTMYVEVDGELDFRNADPALFPLDTGTAKLRLSKKSGAVSAALNNIPVLNGGGMFLPDSLTEVSNLSFTFGRTWANENFTVENKSFGLLTSSMTGTVSNCSFTLNTALTATVKLNNYATDAENNYGYGVIGVLNGSVSNTNVDLTNFNLDFQVAGTIYRTVTVSAGTLAGRMETSGGGSVKNLTAAGSVTVRTNYTAKEGTTPIRWYVGGVFGYFYWQQGAVGSVLPTVSGVSSSVSVTVGGTAEKQADLYYTVGGCFGYFGLYPSSYKITVDNCAYLKPAKLEIKDVNLLSTAKLNAEAGGVFGKLTGSSFQAKYCYNTAAVKVLPPNAGVSGDVSVGGIAGSAASSKTSKVNDFSMQKIIASVNAGDVSAGSNGAASSAKLSLGGIIGSSDKVGLDQTRNMGEIQRTAETSDAGKATFSVGGLIGRMQAYTSGAGFEASNNAGVVSDSENVGTFSDSGAGASATGGLFGVFSDEKASDYSGGTSVGDSAKHYVSVELSASHGKGFQGGIVGKVSTESYSYYPSFSVKDCLVSSVKDTGKGISAETWNGNLFTSGTNCWYSDPTIATLPNGFHKIYSFDEFSVLDGNFVVDRKFFNDIYASQATYPAPSAIAVKNLVRGENAFRDDIYAVFTDFDYRPRLWLFGGGRGTESSPFQIHDETQFFRIAKIPDDYLPNETRYIEIWESFSVSLIDNVPFSIRRISIDGRGNALSIASDAKDALFPTATDCAFQYLGFVTESGTELPAFTVIDKATNVNFQNVYVDFKQKVSNQTNYPALCKNRYGVNATNVVVVSATNGTGLPSALPISGGGTETRVYVATTADRGASPAEHSIFLRDKESFGSAYTAEKTDVTFGIRVYITKLIDYGDIRQIAIDFSSDFTGYLKTQEIALYGDKEGKVSVPFESSQSEILYLDDTSTYGDLVPRITRTVYFYEDGKRAGQAQCYLSQNIVREASYINGKYFTGRFTAADGGVDLGGADALDAPFSFSEFGQNVDFNSSYSISVYHRYKEIRLLSEERVFDKTTDNVWTDTENGREYAGAVTVLSGGSAIRDVGEYRYEISVKRKGSTSEKPLGTVSGSVKITPLEVTVTPRSGDNLTKVYDGTSDVDIKYGFDCTNVVYSSDFSGKLAIGNSDAGRYPVNLGTLTLGKNYTIALRYAEFVITKKTLSNFVWTFPESAVYDKSVKVVTVTDPTNTIAGESASVVISAVRNGVPSEIKNAGTYQLTVAGAENPNYDVDVTGNSAGAVYIIEKATANVTVKQYSTVTYDAEVHFPAVVYNGTDEPFIEEEIKIVYRDSAGNVFAGAKNAGIYDGLTVAFLPFTGNFNEIETKPARLTIEKRAVKVRFPGIETLTYTGRAVTLTAEVFGMLANEKIVAKIKYGKGGAAVNAPVEPGDYTATVATDALLLDGAPPINYCLDKAVSVNFSIGKAEMRDPQITVGTLTYMDDTLSKLKVEARFRDVNNKYIASFRTEILTPDRKLEAGTIEVAIRFTAVGDVAEYYNPYETTVEVTVNPKKITIAAVKAEGQYGDAPPAFEFTGGEEVWMVGDRFDGALALDRTDKLPAGEYNIGIGNLTAGKNYEIIYVPAVYTVRPRRVSGTFGTIPYFVYDGKEKPVSIEILNTIEGDELGVTLVYYRVGSAEATRPIDAGSYRVVAEAMENPNYTFGNALPQAQFTIARATVGTLVFEDKTVEYDGMPHSVEIAELPEFVEAVYSKTAVKDAGVYPITASFTLSDNYAPIAPITATLTITKAVITGFDLAPFERLVYEGKPIAPRVFAADAKADDRVEAVYETDREIYDVGSYEGRITGVSDNNYELAAPVDFSFTVGKRPVKLVLKREIIKSYDGTTDVSLTLEDFEAEGLFSEVSLFGEPAFRLAEAGEAGGKVAILIEGLTLRGERADRFELVTDGNFAEVRLTSVKDGSGNSLFSPNLNLGAGATLAFEAGDSAEFEKTIEGVDASYRVTGVYRIVLRDAEGNSVALPSDTVASFTAENAERLSAVYVSTSEGLKLAEFTVDGNVVTVHGASGTLVLVERSVVYDVLTLVGIVLGAIAAVVVVLMIVRSKSASNRRKKR